MKASELLEILLRHQQYHPDDDLEVMVRVRNPSVGPSPAIQISGAHRGGDWDKGRLMLTPVRDLVAFQVTAKALPQLAAERLEVLKSAHDRVFSRYPGSYIPKAREGAWIEGFVEGFWAFGLSVDKAGENI